MRGNCEAHEVIEIHGGIGQAWPCHFQSLELSWKGLAIRNKPPLILQSLETSNFSVLGHERCQVARKDNG